MAAKLKKNHFVIHPDGLFRFRIAVIMRVDRYKSFTPWHIPEDCFGLRITSRISPGGLMLGVILLCEFRYFISWLLSPELVRNVFPGGHFENLQNFNLVG